MHNRGRARHSTLATGNPNSNEEINPQYTKKSFGNGTMSHVNKAPPPAEYNGVTDHLMSSLKPCVSSHSFNYGKMSTVKDGSLDILPLLMRNVYEELDCDSQLPMRIFCPALSDLACTVVTIYINII